MEEASYGAVMAVTRHPHPTPAGLAAELQQLAHDLAAGTRDRSADIVRLARSAEALELEPGSVAALLDPTSAPIVRERAAVRLSLAAERTQPLRRRVSPTIPANAHLRHGALPAR